MKKIFQTTSYILILVFFLSLTSPLSTEAKESKYHIKVNRLTNNLTIYKLTKGNYKPIKAMLCSTGGALTPLGTFHTKQKQRWHTFYDGSFGQYSTRINGPYLFHSLPYTKKSPNTMIPTNFGKLGSNASAGCVRLNVADAKWIYSNCSLGTKVTIYESKNPGPLGKPESIPYEEENGYDPTDVWAKGNPILKKKPKIESDGDLVVLIEDTEVDFLKGITAYSSLGEDITDDITYEENVDFSTPGEYKVLYMVKDSLKRKATLERMVIVK